MNAKSTEATIDDISEKLDREIERFDDDRKYLRNLLEDVRASFMEFKTDTLLWRERFDPVAAKIAMIEQKQLQEDIMHAQIRGGIRVLLWMVPIVNVLVIGVLVWLQKHGLL